MKQIDNETIKKQAVEMYKSCVANKLDLLAIDYLDPINIHRYRTLLLGELVEVTPEELVNTFKIARALYSLGKRLSNE